MDDAPPHGDRDRLGPVVCPQLVHNVLEVHLDGLLGDEQEIGDLPIPVAGGHVAKNLHLTLAQRVAPMCSASPAAGRSTQTLANDLGIGGQNSGFNPLYQIGGPRSIQLAIKPQF